MNFITRKYAIAIPSLLTVSLTGLASPALAQALECGTTYTVQSGDSLSQLANEVYGSAGQFQIIYSANAEVIGSNPGLVSVGTKLQIPCIDGTVPQSTANTAVITIEETVEALAAPRDQVIRVVTGTDWAPFTNEDEEQGGMITEITNVALSLADGAPEYKIDFVNDWSAHLNPLITDHAYDFSIGWYKPNCEFVDRLSEDSQFRCNNLDWSAPMYEQIFGYYTRVGDEIPESYEDLFGKRICRPDGFSTFMLEENGLVDPNASILREGVISDCFVGLVDGEYDAVALAIDTAESAIAETGLVDQVYYNEPLSQVLTIHAVIAKTNPNAEQYVATLDSGIQALKDSGEWFNIIRRHLTAHRSQN